jgi:hypothetical protein
MRREKIAKMSFGVAELINTRSTHCLRRLFGLLVQYVFNLMVPGEVRLHYTP